MRKYQCQESSLGREYISLQSINSDVVIACVNNFFGEMSTSKIYPHCKEDFDIHKIGFYKNSYLSSAPRTPDLSGGEWQLAFNMYRFHGIIDV